MPLHWRHLKVITTNFQFGYIISFSIPFVSINISCLLSAQVNRLEFLRFNLTKSRGRTIAIAKTMNNGNTG